MTPELKTHMKLTIFVHVDQDHLKTCEIHLMAMIGFKGRTLY